MIALYSLLLFTNIQYIILITLVVIGCNTFNTLKYQLKRLEKKNLFAIVTRVIQDYDYVLLNGVLESASPGLTLQRIFTL